MWSNEWSVMEKTEMHSRVSSRNVRTGIVRFAIARAESRRFSPSIEESLQEISMFKRSPTTGSRRDRDRDDQGRTVNDDEPFDLRHYLPTPLDFRNDASRCPGVASRLDTWTGNRGNDDVPNFCDVHRRSPLSASNFQPRTFLRTIRSFSPPITR